MMIEQKRKDVGNRVKYYRKLANMTQDELAIKSGFAGKASISQIEKGQVNLTEQKIESIAKALGVEESVLRYGEDFKSAYDPSDIVFKTSDMDKLPEEEAQAVMKAYNRLMAYYRNLAKEYRKKEGDSDEH